MCERIHEHSGRDWFRQHETLFSVQVKVADGAQSSQSCLLLSRIQLPGFPVGLSPVE